MIITINPSAALEALVDVLQPDPALHPYNIWGEHLVKLWVMSTWILLDLSFTEVKSVAVTLVDSYIGLLKVKRNLSQTKNCIQGLLLIYMFLVLLNAISYRIIHFKMCYKRRRPILLKHNMVKGHWSLCSTWETASCSFLAQIFSKAVKYPAESPSLICARAGRPSGALCNPTPRPGWARWQGWAISWGTVGRVHAGSRGSPRVLHGIAGLLTDLIPHLTETRSAGRCCREPSMLRLLKIKYEPVSDVYTGLAAELIDATVGVCGSELYWIDSNAILNRFPYAWLFIISKSQLEIRSKSSRRIRSQCWSTHWWKNTKIFSYYLTEKLGYFTKLHFGGVAKSVKWQQFICEHHWSVFASSQVS